MEEHGILEPQAWRGPSIFWPIHLRNGDKYRALQRYRFSAEEKLWVCDHIVSSCEDIESDIDGDISVFCKRYHLNPSIVIVWINQYADGVSFTQRICPIDSNGIHFISGLIARGANIGESQIDYQNRLYDCVIVEKNRSYLDRGY